MYKVLFLEDELSLVQALPRLLKSRGLNMIGTTSIIEAIELFANEDFDAVLLDIMMPPAEDMDAEALDYGRKTGVEVARRMQAQKPAAPIVALTVVRDRDIQARMREAGIVEIINKPAETEQIVETLLRTISRAQRVSSNPK